MSQDIKSDAVDYSKISNQLGMCVLQNKVSKVCSVELNLLMFAKFLTRTFQLPWFISRYDRISGLKRKWIGIYIILSSYHFTQVKQI